ncbi:MAG TPA: DUF2442 domain-containing protein [Pyrinomonadaceae bacterium]|jgi:hypothetical protein
MAAGKKEKTKLPMTEAEFGRQYRAAVKRGGARAKAEPSAVRAYYDQQADRVVVELNNDCAFIFPPALAQGLRGAAGADLAEIEVLPTGYGLRWPKLDADFTVAGLLAGVFGSRAWMAELGRQGGRVSSEAKAAAARENGRKGGRPKTKKPAA